MMTDTMVGVNPPSPGSPAEPGDTAPERDLSPAEIAVIEGLVRQAKDQGVALTGPDGLLKTLTKTVIETALDEEMSEHLGYDKHAPEGRNRGNSRNGTRSKTVLTDSCGEVEIRVPRDRDASFQPQLVRKRQRRLSDVDEVVLSLYAKGLTTGEISVHFADVYGVSVSKEHRVADHRPGDRGDANLVGPPLEKVYAVIFIDAIMVKIRDGQVRNRPIYAAIGVDLDGHKDILGMWAGDGDGESAKFWLAVLTGLRNRGVKDVFFVPFLDYDVEIRKVICSTNAIESLNARYRRAVRARGHFPNEQAAMKTLHLVTRSLDPKGTGQTRWVTRWKPALNAFAITFADRMPAAENN